MSGQHVGIGFGGVPALRSANLSVAAGEVHALIGQNGAGKSTMIKILTGAYRRGSGSVRFEGREVDFRTPKQAREAGISTIYQEINLVAFRSVAENIFLGREPRRFGLIDWRAVQQRAAALLESFGLQIDVKKPVGRYSTAIQQMVALARAVSSDAKMVIMDESTSSLDEREVELLFTVVRKLRDDCRAVIFVSHRLDELYALCDRVTVMRDGQTVAQSTMAEMDKLQLVTTMLGRTLAKNGVVDVKKQQAIVDRFIASLGIKLRSADQPIRELSGGNQQKVLLARWLAAEPWLLLLDEPTRGIDVGAKADVAKIVRELRDAGLAVLLSASELEEPTAVADRAVVIRDGRTVAELNGADMSETAIMDAIAYGSEGQSQLIEAAQTAHIEDALEGDRHGA
jgi:ABC-type sugar transport system ATPase subunit